MQRAGVRCTQLQRARGHLGRDLRLHVKSQCINAAASSAELLEKLAILPPHIVVQGWECCCTSSKWLVWAGWYYGRIDCHSEPSAGNLLNMQLCQHLHERRGLLRCSASKQQGMQTLRIGEDRAISERTIMLTAFSTCDAVLIPLQR
jgi:hypothetical protein